MPPTWYVSFEGHRRGLLPKKRSPRETRTFPTEAEAKLFARAILAEGLIVFAGTINPHAPRRLVPPGEVQDWLAEDESPPDPPIHRDGD
jgi:hypothetical protein